MEITPASLAPDFKAISGWANSPPLSMKALKGKVVLLDCWTYTCIFCLRTLPVLKRLYSKYAQDGLVVIEAHSYEYEFAKEHSNIAKALLRYRVSDVPVAFDTENRTWEAYGNTYWPKHILIDHNGLTRYEHAGYGSISDFEGAVVELLEEAGKKPAETSGLDVANPEDEIYDTYGMQFVGMAPEICVGYSRLRKFGNRHKMKPDSANIMSDSGSHEVNTVYLRGKWTWERERVAYSAGGREPNPAVIMYYNSAKRVHGIMGTVDGEPGKAEIRLDGKPLSKDQLGKDCRLESGNGSEGQISVVDVTWPFMHNLVRTDKPEVHEIEIIPRSANFAFYTFVFG